MSCNDNQLLRRPLPSQKNKKFSPKRPVKLPAIAQKDHHHEVFTTTTRINNSRNNFIDDNISSQIKSKNHKGEGFDIFEDGDKNLFKPLGPEPFFPTYAIK